MAVPLILRLVEEALKADDSKIERAIDKLDSRVRAIPDPINHGESLEEFKARFGSYDEKTLMLLYKGCYLSTGPEFVKSHVLAMIRRVKRGLEDAREDAASNQLDPNWKTQRIRQMLTVVKEDLRPMASNP